MVRIDIAMRTLCSVVYVHIYENSREIFIYYYYLFIYFLLLLLKSTKNKKHIEK